MLPDINVPVTPQQAVAIHTLMEVVRLHCMGGATTNLDCPDLLAYPVQAVNNNTVVGINEGWYPTYLGVTAYTLGRGTEVIGLMGPELALVPGTGVILDQNNVISGTMASDQIGMRTIELLTNYLNATPVS